MEDTSTYAAYSCFAYRCNVQAVDSFTKMNGEQNGTNFGIFRDVNFNTKSYFPNGGQRKTSSNRLLRVSDIFFSIFFLLPLYLYILECSACSIDSFHIFDYIRVSRRYVRREFYLLTTCIGCNKHEIKYENGKE